MSVLFVQQQHAGDISLFEFEKELRDDIESIDSVRNLTPTSYRFRVVNAQRRDIRDRLNTAAGEGYGFVETESTFDFDDSTRVTITRK